MKLSELYYKRALQIDVNHVAANGYLGELYVETSKPALARAVLKESAKKANFPGFRKGQVPPFAMPQIRGFAVQESIIRTCQSAVDAYGLKSVSGSDGEVEVLEDIPELAKSYKLGDDIEFTATFNASEDPDVEREEGTIEAEAEVVESE